MHTLFISDLHLSPSTPKLNQAFVYFLQQEALFSDGIYILGDLFDFWIGDGDRSNFADVIRKELAALTSTGVPCYFVKGNRDFLVGHRFAKETGVTLMPDESVINLYGHSILLMHGDTLCTGDQSYQILRKKLRTSWLRSIYDIMPFKLKSRIASKIKCSIKKSKKRLSPSMDVAPSAVMEAVIKYKVSHLIHGHTHQPETHYFRVRGAEKYRIVLGDWGVKSHVLKIDSEFNVEFLRNVITASREGIKGEANNKTISYP